MRIRCEKCGTIHDARGGHKCPSNRMGMLIGVRCHPELVEKLDEVRGSATRPAYIREILEREL